MGHRLSRPGGRRMVWQARWPSTTRSPSVGPGPVLSLCGPDGVAWAREDAGAWTAQPAGPGA